MFIPFDQTRQFMRRGCRCKEAIAQYVCVQRVCNLFIIANTDKFYPITLYTLMVLGEKKTADIRKRFLACRCAQVGFGMKVCRLRSTRWDFNFFYFLLWLTVLDVTLFLTIRHAEVKRLDAADRSVVWPQIKVTTVKVINISLLAVLVGLEQREMTTRLPLCGCEAQSAGHVMQLGCSLAGQDQEPRRWSWKL